jgi:chromosome segregation ATPase
MFFETLFSVVTLLIAFNIRPSAGLLISGNSNSTSVTFASSGHHISSSEILQILQNQTTELTNLKQQTENDRSSMQMLQNRVFFLEAELRKLNASRPPSSDELSAYLSNMKQIVQTLTANDEYDKNITKRLNDVVKSLENVKVQERYTSLSLLDVHSKTEQLNTTLHQIMSSVNEQLASMI